MSNKVYLNDNNEKTSKLVSVADVPEISGISVREFADRYKGDIKKLNKDLYEFSFSDKPKFKV